MTALILVSIIVNLVPIFLLSNLCTIPISIKMWHNRIGHPHSKVLQNVIQSNNLKYDHKSVFYFCKSCCYGKTQKIPFSKSSTTCSSSLEIVHTDLWGPSSIKSFNGCSYFMHFMDSYSRYTWIYFLKTKSKAFDTFLKFKFMVELQFNTKIKTIQSNGGGEFQTISKYLLSQGIIHHKSCPHTPEQNGTAKRKIRHIVETGLTLLATASLPLKFWDEAFYTTTLLINRLPTPLLSFKTPFEKLFHTQPDYSSLRAFGCSCFPLLKLYNKHKMNFKSEECTLIEYSPFHKGFKCPTTSGKVIITRHVTFDETSFPFATKTSNTDTGQNLMTYERLLPSAQPPLFISHNAPCAAIECCLPGQITTGTNNTFQGANPSGAGPTLTSTGVVNSIGNSGSAGPTLTGPGADHHVPSNNNAAGPNDACATRDQAGDVPVNHAAGPTDACATCELPIVAVSFGDVTVSSQ